MKNSLAVIAAMLVPATIWAAPPTPRSVWLHGPIKVSVDGKATIGALDGAKGALEAYVRNELAKRRFHPATIGGQAREAEAHVTAVVSLTPRGGDYDVEIEQAFVSPMVKQMPPPRYPRSMFESRKTGYAELRLAIAADGSVERIVSASATDPAFERAAREAVQGARFNPIRAAGQAVASETSVQAFFRIERDPFPDIKPSCAVDDRQPRIEGQNGCIAPIEVSASRR